MLRAAVLSARTPVLRRAMPGSLFARELLVTASRPRALVLKVAIPLVLTLPLLAGHAPTFWAGMLLTALTAMTGTVGAAISVARARESGLLAGSRSRHGRRAARCCAGSPRRRSWMRYS